MKHLAHTAPPSAQTGFTLLELLVALLIISLGILGHAKMQMKTMHIAQQASYSQTANTALLDLAERLKADKSNTQSGSYDLNITRSASLATSSAKDCITSSTCTAEQFAQYELHEWYSRLALPNHRLGISHDGALFTLLLTWDAGKNGSGSDHCDLSNGYHCAELTLWLP